jgi:hypothetical protein
MKKVLEALYQFWNWLMVYWNLNFLIRNYLRLDIEVLSALVMAVLFSYFLFIFYRNKYFANQITDGKYLLVNFLIGLACIFFDILIVFCIKFKGLSLG